MSEESIAHKTARTTLWAGIEKFTTMGVQFVVSLVLARLLCPSDYGTVAMLTIFIEICGTFISCGFGNALIRKADCTSVDLSTALYFNVIVALVMYAMLFVGAPYVAEYYGLEILCPLLRWTGLTLIINALSLVQYTLLSKKLHARKQANISIVCSLASAVVGIAMAYCGCGVWSLVAQGLSFALIQLIILWITTTWRPKWEFSKESMRYLWNFGSKMLLTGIISVTYKNIYSLVIGKFYNNASLGLFNRGQSLAQLLPNITEGVFIKNSLPIFSQLQKDNDRLIFVYREYIKIACFVTIPAVCLISVLAAPFVEFFLTAKWEGCVIYIQIFALTSFIVPANSINLNLLQTYGRSDYTLYAEILKKSIGLITVFSLIPLGPLWLAVGSSIFNLFAYFVNLYYAKRLSNLKYKDQIMDIMPIIVCSGMMYAIVYISIYFIHNSLIQMLLGGVVGVFSYIVLAKYVFRMKQFDYIKNLKR